VLDVQQIIPLPEAAAYRIEQEHKQREVARSRTGDRRDLTKYVLVVDDTPSAVLNKRQVVRTAVQELLDRGVPFDEVREAVGAGALASSPTDRPCGPANSLRTAASRRPATRRLVAGQTGIRSGRTAWIMLKVGGTDTERLIQVLTDLAARRLGRPLLRWEALPDQTAVTCDSQTDD
jgi:hypothetical protein